MGWIILAYALRYMSLGKWDVRRIKGRMGVLPQFTDKKRRRRTISARPGKILPNFELTIIPGSDHALLNTVDRGQTVLHRAPADFQSGQAYIGVTQLRLRACGDSHLCEVRNAYIQMDAELLPTAFDGIRS